MTQFSVDLESHSEKLSKTLSRIQQANFKIKPSKCELLQISVRFLGHVISGQCNATDPGKVGIISDIVYLGGWIAKWVALSGRVRKSRVRFPAAQKCWAQMEFVNICQFRFHPMLKYACVYCVRFI